ncbi:hypothetical protein LH427_02665 [Laribacter hongkongensis]|uniref:hypothetical protein n=1 Tax=Laribacter hongkongensis TaxID=168471 RepID=UPI001EFE0952|nr:hypothetical protein [Laribacter hongkongensis]MCG8997807.1 hypothetical protein [Laribacter hongkongensis]MCG9004132.1 hypothetical protein [Laribacter hongkongensis]MCG9019101.1 hypothetical protein [Laribacter hongkongensis]MCG9027814.1 hypothetical protein [Laribacter hongkongensis]MCG9035631.1 hypothetical protein [Laribacter hongkongensis]
MPTDKPSEAADNWMVLPDPTTNWDALSFGVLTKVRLAGEMVPVTALLKTTDVMLLLLSRWTSVTTVPYGIPAP